MTWLQSKALIIICHQQTEEFMRECGWKVLQFNEVAHVATRVAPGFQHNCGALQKSKDDYIYFFMVAKSS